MRDSGTNIQSDRLSATPKIAFLFLIYNSINQEDLWSQFFENVDPEKYSIHIHYKSNKKLKHFEDHKLSKCIRTKYAHVSIIHAHNALIQSALEDPANTKFINLSQACIPLKPFDDIYSALTKDNYAHFNILPQEQCFPRCKRLLQYIPEDKISKSYNWFILNRHLAQMLSRHSKSYINQRYKKIFCPEEHYYISELLLMEAMDQVRATFNKTDEATTFTNWSDMSYRFPSEKNLKTYTSISPEEVDHLLKAPCLFGRKFEASCVVDTPSQTPLSDYLGNRIAN